MSFYIKWEYNGVCHQVSLAELKTNAGKDCQMSDICSQSRAQGACGVPAVVPLPSVSELKCLSFILTYFSGTCPSKIFWEFMIISTVEKSSPKMSSLTAHTFSSWKCECEPEGSLQLTYGAFLSTLFHVLVPGVHFGFMDFVSGVAVTWQKTQGWNCLFIICDSFL